MKTILSCFCFLFFSIISLQAQVRVAIVGGAHSSTVIEKNEVPGFDSIKQDFSGRTGVHFGFMADMPIGINSSFYFQPGIIFYNKGRKYFSRKDTAVSDISTVTFTQYINYVDMPMNLVYKRSLGKNAKLMLGAGPYASLFYNGKEQTQTSYKSGDFNDDLNEDVPVGKGKSKYAVFNYGLNALLGLESGRASFTVNASHGLNNFYQSPEYDGSFRHLVIGGSLGIYLGKYVKPEPKIKDKDQDGVPDLEDACPELAGSLLSNGCPDKDADGVADKDDQCPDVAGLSKYKGCPVPDTDKDGVNDEEDKCPGVAGFTKYNGCPIPDTDKDGLNDEEDKCPEMAGVARFEGCPVPDADNDGINDEDDKCPLAAGTKENNGCPVVTNKIIEQVEYAARKLQFKIYSVQLTKESLLVLDEVASLLKLHPELKLTIEGHTSTDGIAEANLILSEKRAQEVKKYLESQDIEPERLSAIGYGETKPLNNGKTPAEKAKNRRVELKLSN